MRSLLCVALLAAAGQAGATGIAVRPYGVTAAGTNVERVTLTNDRGMQLSYIDYGATIVAATAADRSGARRNVVLDLPDLAAYQRSTRKWGAIIGRYAGRIGGARYTLDGKTVQLQPNLRGLTIHGGPPGYEHRVWQRRDFADSASIGSVYTLVSPDGDQSFPGKLALRVTYRLLRASDEFRIEYEAVTDAPTVVNFTNHAYFNLAGAGSRGLATHRFQIDADRYAVTDANRVPTGELASVAQTPLDFRRPASAAARLQGPSALLGDPPGFDHSLVLTKAPGKLARVAVIDDTASGIRMTVGTTEPSAQFYTANAFDGKEVGSSGTAYERYDGFAFETQHLPDSPNQPAFPSTALRPGDVFRSVTSFRFTRQ
ncbi:aldose epimerase family protein [Pseudoduganella chitinolytica]|uniref:Aldose 1-epimerase n=1 Tax=Pseudoduganella chitinolytica TaxID=34070 RepID=A0ABY8B628_9BURK|nr:aldose epimerase family protein [Pseudoduganella chitinolytica]WEF31382.1 galactose mutarotase [Pseudoduganella chitinolytica]